MKFIDVVYKTKDGADPTGANITSLTVNGQELFPFISEWGVVGEGGILYVTITLFARQVRHEFEIDTPDERVVYYPETGEVVNYGTPNERRISRGK